MKHSVVSACLISAMILSACGKKESGSGAGTPAPTVSALAFEKSPLFQEWEQLILGSPANLELAEMLALAVANETKSPELYLKDYSEEEINQLFKKIKHQEVSARTEALYGTEDYAQDLEFLDSTLIRRPVDLYASSNSIESSIRLSRAVNEQRKYLSDVSKTLNGRLKELAKEIGPFVLEKLAAAYPEEMAQIREETISSNNLSERNTQRIVRLILKTDDLQEFLATHTQDEILEKAQTAAAHFIAEKVKEELTRSRHVQKVIRTLERAEEIRAKIKEVVLIAGIINENLKNVDSLTTIFKKGAEEFARSAHSLKNELQNEKVRAIVISYAADRILNHSRQGQEIKKAARIAETAIKDVDTISRELKNMSRSASGLLNNFSVILSASQSLSRTLGIRLPHGVNKVISDVAKVAAAVNLAQSTLTAFGTTGPIGALVAFNAGGGAALLSGGASGFEGEVRGQFSQINVKLDEIIKMQKTMINLQLDTMKMINDLATLLDAYHQEEMNALSDIKIETSLIARILISREQADIQSCKSVIASQLSSRSQMNFTHIWDVENLSQTRYQLYTSISSPSKFVSIIRSQDANAYARCTDRLSETFSSNDGYLFINRTFDHSLQMTNAKLENEVFLPLLTMLPRNVNIRRSALHLPITELKDSVKKQRLVYDDGKSVPTSLTEWYSPDLLIEYVTNLLLFAPMMELNEDEWSRELTTDLSRITMNTKEHARVPQLLFRALELSHKGIAQQAILAGEPFFGNALKTFENSLAKGSINELTPTEVAIRKNKVMLRNLISYKINVTNKHSEFDINAYSEAFYSKSSNALNNLLFGGQNLVSEKNGVLFYSDSLLGISFELASPEVVQKGKVEYWNDMGRLIGLQEKILEAISKAKLQLEQEDKETLANLLMAKTVGRK